MKKINKFYHSLSLILLVACLIIVSACSKGGEPAGSSTSSPTKSPDSGTQPTEEAINTGKYDPPIKLTTINTSYDINDTLPAGQNIDNNVWTKAYSEQLGIEVETLYSAASGGSVVDKMKLLIATNKLPDIFNISPMDYDDLIKAGKIADLTDAYEKYASPALKEMYESDGGQILNMAKRDGKLYGLPTGNGYTESPTMLLVRKDWLDKLSLQPPKTMDDVYKIADAFMNDDPDGNNKKDTYGIGAYSTLFAWDASFSGFFSANNAYPATASGFIHWVEQDGKLLPGYKQAETRTALLKLQELYNTGVLSKEWATMDGNKLTEDIAQSKVGIYFGSVWDADYHNKSLKKLDPNAEFLILPLPSLDGTAPAKTAVPAPFIYTIGVVNAKFANPEAIIKIANLQLELLKGPNADAATYFTNSDGNKMWKMQVIMPGVDPDNGYKSTLPIMDAVRTGDPSKLTPTSKAIYDEVMRWERDKDVDWWGVARVFGPENSSFAVVDHYVKNDLFHVNKFHGQQLPVMKIYWNNLWDKANEAMTKVIMGDDIKVWDDFLAYWDKQGGADMEEEVNEWYKNQQ